MKIIPYGRQCIDHKDLKSVNQALKKEKITTGQNVEKFEKKLENFLKCKYSTVCNSGTSAILLAMQSINVAKNDVVIMPTINFIASYNVAKILGAKVFLADVDKYTGQMTPQDVIDCCRKFNLKTVKAVIVMYHSGKPLNAEKFKNLKKKYNCTIIEDACHALGAEYKFRNKFYKIGSCKHSDICTFSLHPVKTITTGEGGIVTTNNQKIAKKVKSLVSLGINRKKKHWEYDVDNYGLNLRMNDFQSALGISQLKKINVFLRKRESLFEKYIFRLKEIDSINLPSSNKNYKSANHLFIINIKGFNKFKKEKLIKYMLKNKIILQYHYIPIYKFKVFKDKFMSKNAEIFFKTSVSLPIFYNMSLKSLKKVTDHLKKYFKIY